MTTTGGRNTFRKGERLTSLALIGQLFKPGPDNHIFHSYPLRVVFRLLPPAQGAFPAQVAVVVSKKYSKKAHERQLIRRRMREAYRLHKNWLYNCVEPKGHRLAMAISYAGRKEEDYATIERAWQKCVAQICKTVSQMDS